MEVTTKAVRVPVDRADRGIRRKADLVKTYDLSQFAPPDVGKLREAASLSRVKGIAVDRQFWAPDVEVNLADVEQYFKELIDAATKGLQMARKFQGK